MNILLMALPILLAVIALFLLLTHRSKGGPGTGGDRADFTTDSPNDRPPPAEENINRAKNT